MLLDELDTTELLKDDCMLEDDFTLEDEATTDALDTEQLPPATTPKGDGCAAQVELAMQLLPFS